MPRGCRRSSRPTRSPTRRCGAYSTRRARRCRNGSPRLQDEAGDEFPEKVTAFREGMAVHGRYGTALPRLWSAGAARRLCRERSQLLRDVSDRRPSARRSVAVAAAAGGLAADARGARTPPQRSLRYVECGLHARDRLRRACVCCVPSCVVRAIDRRVAMGRRRRRRRAVRRSRSAGSFAGRRFRRRSRGASRRRARPRLRASSRSASRASMPPPREATSTSG